MRRTLKPRFGIAALLAIFAAGGLPGYHHFRHYPPGDGSVPAAPVVEKFDLSALTDQTVFFFVSSTRPRTVANDSYEAMVSQIRQALSVWDSVPTSALRVAFGGVSDTPLPGAAPAGEIIFAELPPGVIGLGGPVTRADPRDGAMPILRSQVILSNDLTTGSRPRPSFSEIFFTSLVHEIGHALGLQHTLTSSVMSTDVTRSTTRALPLALDDAAGLSALYPNQNFLELFGSLSGRVLTASGAPVHMASVVAVSSDGSVVSALTTPDGTYRIEGLAPGEWLVYVHPLPPATQDGLGPANIVLPTDGTDRVIPASGPFRTVFHGGANRPEESTPLKVAAGVDRGEVDFRVDPIRASRLFNITTFSFPGNGAAGVHPAFLDVNRLSPFILATGPGLIQNLQAVSLEVLGGDVTVRPPAIYPFDARFAIIRFGSTLFSPLTPKHLLFRLGNDIYILPSAVRFTAQPAPVIHWITPTVGPDGQSLWRVRGANFEPRSTVYFDGLPAQAVGFDPLLSEIWIRPPEGPSGRAAVVTVYNSDGQSSAFTLPDGNILFPFPSSIAPVIEISPPSSRPGRDLIVSLKGVNTNFVPGETAVGFGTSDIVVREVHIVSPTRLDVVVTVRPEAAPGPYVLSVIRGLEVIALRDSFRVEEEAAETEARPTVRFRSLLNSASMRPEISPGVLATLIGAHLTADTTAVKADPPLVTLNGQACRILSAAPGRINLQVPLSLDLGPAVLEVENELGRSDPMLVDIQRASPGLFGAFDAAGDAISEQNPAIPGRRLVLTATGLGRLATLAPDAAAAVSPANRPPLILLGGQRIEPSSVRPAGNFPGLYEISFTLPAFSTSLSQEVSLLAEGRRSNALRIEVRRPSQPPDNPAEPDERGKPAEPSSPVDPDGTDGPDAPDTLSPTTLTGPLIRSRNATARPSS